MEDHQRRTLAVLMFCYDFGASLGVIQRVEILPFHQMGRYKWERLNLDYKLAETDPPTRDGVSKAIAIFREAGLNAA